MASLFIRLDNHGVESQNVQNTQVTRNLPLQQPKQHSERSLGGQKVMSAPLN